MPALLHAKSTQGSRTDGDLQPPAALSPAWAREEQDTSTETFLKPHTARLRYCIWWGVPRIWPEHVRNWGSCRGTTAIVPGIFCHFVVTLVLPWAHVPLVWLGISCGTDPIPCSKAILCSSLPSKTNLTLSPAPLLKLARSASPPASPSPSLQAWKATAKCVSRHICLTSVFVGRMKWVWYSPLCHFSTCLVFRMKAWSGP